MKIDCWPNVVSSVGKKATIGLGLWFSCQIAQATPAPIDLAELEVKLWTSEDHELPEIERQVVRAIQIDPYSARAHQLLSQTLKRMFALDPGDMHLLKQSSDAAQQAIDLDPRSDAGYVALADVLDLMGNPDKALALLDDAQNSGLEPSWRFYFTRSRLVADDVDTKKVLGLLETALAFTDSQPRIVVPYVVAILQSESSGKALVQRLETWNTMFPSPLFDLTLAISYAETGNPKVAHAIYKKILAKDPTHREALVNDAILLYRELNQPQKGLALLDKAQDSHKGSLSPAVSAMIHAHRGAAQLTLKSWPAAERSFKAAFASRGQNIALLDFLARKYRQAEAHEALASLLEQINDVWPGTSVVHALLAEVQSEKLGKHDAAIESFANAIILDPSRSDYYNGMGLAFYRKRALIEALKLFTTATEVDPTDATARYNEACVFALLDRPEDALKSLADALTLDPRLVANARADEDFAGIRHVGMFQRLVEGTPPGLNRDVIGH